MATQRQPIIQKIRKEAHRTLGKYPPLFGAFRVKARWLRVLSRLTGTSIKGVDGMLYVLGDSHTNFFGGEEFMRNIHLSEGISVSLNLIPFIRTYHIGPATAYNLPQIDSRVQARRKTEEIIQKDLIPKGSLILLSFGEIDCRVHLVKQAEQQGRPLEAIARDVVENYMMYADWLVNKGFRVACWGAIASQKEYVKINPGLPRYGTEGERNQATLVYNRLLEEECRKRNIRFCSIFPNMVDEELLTVHRYISADNIHLSQRAAPLTAAALLDAGVIRVRGSRIEVAED